MTTAWEQYVEHALDTAKDSFRPIKPHDPTWTYTPAVKTDIRETWRRYTPEADLPAFLRRQVE